MNENYSRPVSVWKQCADLRRCQLAKLAEAGFKVQDCGMEPLRVDVLFFEGCPSHQATVALVREVARSLGTDVDVREIEVTGPEDARRLRFPGSPTVQVNGEDIEPSRREQAHYVMSCRLYGRSGIPPRGLIEAAFARKRSG